MKLLPRPPQSRLPILTAATTGLLLTFLVTSLLVNRDDAATSSRLDRITTARAHLLAVEVAGALELAASMGDLHNADDELSHETFARYADRTLARHPELQALEWVPVVRAEERSAYEATHGPITERDADGYLHAAAARAVYHPVAWIEPLQGNQQAIGYDLGSDPARHRALELARDGNTSSVSAPIELVQGGEGGTGLLIVHPVYTAGPAPTTTAERRARLRGHALGVFLSRDLFELGHDPPAGDVFLELEDVTESPLAVVRWGSLQGGSTISVTKQIPLPGRSWRLRARATPAAMGSDPWPALFSGVAGLVCTLLSMLIIRDGAAHTTTVDRMNANLEDRVRVRTRELEAANAELEHFATLASHDLQEPLRTLTSCVEALEEDLGPGLGPEQAELLMHAGTGSRRMQRLIHDLLSYARVEGPRERITVDLAQSIEDARQTLAGAITDTHAEVEHGELPSVRADTALLRQLFVNLIGNAIKYRSDAAPHIQIDAESIGTRLCVSIEDNGIGVPEEAREAVFELFHRLHHQDDRPGTGVGLAICRRIVTQHEGRIWLEGRSDGGTIVRFTLPADT